LTAESALGLPVKKVGEAAAVVEVITIVITCGDGMPRKSHEGNGIRACQLDVVPLEVGSCVYFITVQCSAFCTSFSTPPSASHTADKRQV